MSARCLTSRLWGKSIYNWFWGPIVIIWWFCFWFCVSRVVIGSVGASLTWYVIIFIESLFSSCFHYRDGYLNWIWTAFSQTKSKFSKYCINKWIDYLSKLRWAQREIRKPMEWSIRLLALRPHSRKSGSFTQFLNWP